MKSLKLNTLASEYLSKVEMNRLPGGTCCGCACAYAGSGGGSSIDDNCNANAKTGKSSPQEAVKLNCDGVPIEKPFG